MFFNSFLFAYDLFKGQLRQVLKSIREPHIQYVYSKVIFKDRCIFFRDYIFFPKDLLAISWVYLPLIKQKSWKCFFVTLKIRENDCFYINIEPFPLQRQALLFPPAVLFLSLCDADHSHCWNTECTHLTENKNTAQQLLVTLQISRTLCFKCNFPL